MMKHKGMTLIELMVSMGLALFLMSMVMQQFLSAKQHYHKVVSTLESGFEIQQIVELLRDSMKKVGFSPCASINQLMIKDSRAHTEPVQTIGVENGLSLSRMNEVFVKGIKIVQPNQLVVGQDYTISNKHPMIIADCFHAEIHSIQHVQRTRQDQLITLDKPFSFQYLSGFYVGEWIEERFYVAKNSKGEPALFYGKHHPEELSPLVKQLTAKLIKGKESTQIQTTLELIEGKPLLIETMVRTS